VFIQRTSRNAKRPFDYTVFEVHIFWFMTPHQVQFILFELNNCQDWPDIRPASDLFPERRTILSTF